MTEGLPPGGVGITEDEAVARWRDAWTPERVAGRLSGLSAPWCVAGGWAIDLFRGELLPGVRTRPHSDLEIAVPAACFPEVRARFPELAVDVVAQGRLWEDAGPEVMALTHQTWLRDRASGEFRVDVFREPHDGGVWICRRDPSIRLPYGAVVRRTAGGIPYLAPELTLLFKAKAVRPKDRQDFAGALPLLDGAQRRTLATLLARVHPGHGWLAELGPFGD
ncbi:nucleotidyltransferase domain-containing protein [Kitasatospora sp. NPDC004240]